MSSGDHRSLIRSLKILKLYPPVSKGGGGSPLLQTGVFSTTNTATAFFANHFCMDFSEIGANTVNVLIVVTAATPDDPAFVRFDNHTDSVAIASANIDSVGIFKLSFPFSLLPSGPKQYGVLFRKAVSPNTNPATPVGRASIGLTFT